MSNGQQSSNGAAGVNLKAFDDNDMGVAIRFLVVGAVADALQMPMGLRPGRVVRSAPHFGRPAVIGPLRGAAIVATDGEPLPQPGPLSIKIGGKHLNAVGLIFALVMAT